MRRDVAARHGRPLQVLSGPVEAVSTVPGSTLSEAFGKQIVAYGGAPTLESGRATSAADVCGPRVLKIRFFAEFRWLVYAASRGDRHT
jgi:hypothetical protein